MAEPKSDDPGSGGQPQRQRATHKRSRTGCSTCKKRHIRCDESKPICYQTTPPPASRSSTPYTPADPFLLPAQPLAWQSPSAPPPVPTPVPPDWAGHITIDLPFDSREILQHSNLYRQTITGMIPTHHHHHRAATPAVPAREPLHVHTMILWACMHLYFQRGCSMGPALEQTCLHHKVEMMRALKQQQHHRVVSTADDDGGGDGNDAYAGAILCLAVVEAAMDNAEAAATHLGGLFAVVDARMAVRGAAESQSSSQMLPHLALILLSLLSKAQTSSMQQNSSSAFPSPETPLFHTQPDDPTRLQPRYFTPSESAAMDVNDDSIRPEGYATAAHLLVHAMAERTRGKTFSCSSVYDLQILRWLLHCPSQQRHDGGSNPQLWLWKTVLSAYVLVNPDLALPATAPVRVWLGHQVERWKRSGSTQVPDSIADAVLARLALLAEEPGPGSGRSCLRALCYEAGVYSIGG
ncbi:uncharacterized protein PpBr36_10554 [Pyricularia pennisetigena]|uniref:uncharacterized protein n=1 Tax=Pyricularia pennisetigena TaxID=1578925 RepID=UPI0011513DB2|nr:uncharacterized protein PpBr36_10554 [Pyricularia pennisetigena]TLS21176.1 hypothetical protein PpBr36_10554 [Pyricularia pennisetigena]